MTLKLSKREEGYLDLIQDAKVKAQLRKALLEKAAKRDESKQAYLNRKNDFKIVLTQMGFIAVNGTGTRRSAVFSKQQAEVFLAHINEFKKVVESAPDRPTVNSDAESEE